MNNPFVIGSAAIEKNKNIISLVNMELVRQDEENGAIFSLKGKDFKKIFVLNKHILDVVISEDGSDLYVLTYEIIYKYHGVVTENQPEQIFLSDGADFFKKMYITSELVYVITVGDKVLLLDSSTKKIKDITPDLDELDGLESLFFNDGVLKYAVGWHGLLLAYSNDKKWTEITTPSNRILSTVVENSQGEVVIVGQGGVIMHGHPESLKVIEHDWEGYDFWDVCLFSGKVFLLSEIGIFELTEDLKILPVIGRPQKKSIFFSFKSCTNKLWAVGETHILEFDSNKWEEVFSLMK